MSDGSREALTVLGLLPVWRLRQEFVPRDAPRDAPDRETRGDVADTSATALVASMAEVRFLVMASSTQTQGLWRQILMASRGLSGLHSAMSQATVFSAVQRDRLQSVLQDAPAGTQFILLADVDLSGPLEAMVAASSHSSVVVRLTALEQLLLEPQQKRRLWAQLVSLHRERMVPAKGTADQ